MRRGLKVLVIVVFINILMGYNNEIFTFEYDHINYEYLQSGALETPETTSKQLSTADRLMAEMNDRVNSKEIDQSKETMNTAGGLTTLDTRILSPIYTKLMNKQAIFESLAHKFEKSSSIQTELTKVRGLNNKVTETIQLLHEWQMNGRDEQDFLKYEKISHLLEKHEQLLLDRNPIETKLISSGNEKETINTLHLYEQQIHKEYRLLTEFINKLLTEKYGD